MARLPGAATRDGTTRFADHALARRAVHPAHYREAPGGLRLGSIGVGTYLGAPDAPTDLAVEEAVSVALRSGRTNVVDTAINYRFQRAERSVGRAVRSLVDRELVRREELFVATKNGYLAPDAESPLPPQRYLEETLLSPGLLRPSEIVEGSHAMSVGFLKDQFERSRTNLGLETIDLVYLHNAADAQLPVVGREEFHARLSAAFGLLESFRSTGALGAYGLATWECLRSPRREGGHVELEELVALARGSGGAEHGFRFLQFPFNLRMPEAAAARTQTVAGDRMSLFEAAGRLGLGCFTSVPLLQGRLAKEGPQSDGLTPAQTAIQFARAAPGTIGPLIGVKRPPHLAEDLSVAEMAPWPAERIRDLL
jgi:aryl-alcohol dehydrogenase-like predicted oxidoreductase